MSRARLVECVGAVLVGGTVFVCPALGQESSHPGALGEMPVPGGLRRAMAAVGDQASPDRAQSILEFIRRAYSTPGGAALRDGNDSVLALLAFLESAHREEARGLSTGTDDTVPLPLPPETWRQVVFAGQPTTHGLLHAILHSRSTALLYYGLLSLDEPTRAWLAGTPDLLADIVARHAPTFVLVAPGFRVAGGVVQVPGGTRAAPAWEAIVGARAAEPAAFARALLDGSQAGIAYCFAAMAALDPSLVRFALGIEMPAADDVAAARHLAGVFQQLAAGWNIDRRAFWRPAIDPALLLADLAVDESGRPALQGSRRFWTMAFSEASGREGVLRSDELLGGRAAEFWWLCEQIFSRDVAARQRRYEALLFASRLGTRLRGAEARDAVDAVRAAVQYPALAFALERVGLNDPGVLAGAVRRAGQLSENVQRSTRAITQLQGALAIVLRAAQRGGIAPADLGPLLTSLFAVAPGPHGDYEGALVRWVATHLGTGVTATLDADVIRRVSGASAGPPVFVDWEGTRYRIDLAYAEMARLSRVLGDPLRPYLASAASLVEMADALGGPGLTPDQVSGAKTGLASIAQTIGLDTDEGWTSDVPARYRHVISALDRIASPVDQRGAAEIAERARLLADDLLARGLRELTYAVALGQPERGWITAGEIADRHGFGSRPVAGHTAAWELPVHSATGRSSFNVTGSLLGLDVTFAEFNLVRLSSKPPSRKPMLTDLARRAFIDAATLIDPGRLGEAARDRIINAIRRGRARVEATRTWDQGVALAGQLQLGGARAALLPWVVAHDRARLGAFLTLGELLWLGLDPAPRDPALDAWGAPAASRLGCLCLRLPDHNPSELTDGRWGSAVSASTFADLNLRLTELLSDMGMPASLLGAVLASATLEFVDTAVSRDPDDRRGLSEFVAGLGVDALERYLAALTTDGPLVPTNEAVPAARRTEDRR